MQVDPALVAQRSAFGGGASASVLHPIMLGATIAATVLILTLPKRRVIAPFLLVIFLGSIGQQIYIGGVHLFVDRILIVAGLIRCFSARRTPTMSRLAGGWNNVDTAYVIWVLCHSCAAIL